MFETSTLMNCVQNSKFQFLQLRTTRQCPTTAATEVLAKATVPLKATLLQWLRSQTCITYFVLWLISKNAIGKEWAVVARSWASVRIMKVMRMPLGGSVFLCQPIAALAIRLTAVSRMILRH